MLDAYVWPQSSFPGETVALHASTDAPGIDVEVAREGGEREVVWRGTADAVLQPVPDGASSNGCNWAPTAELRAPDRSGFYSVTLRAGDETAHAFFVVRPGKAGAPTLLVLSTATWNAYNDWGGPSLYTGGTQVSFERPMARGFLHKPEPARRKMQPLPDREALWYFEWAEPLGLSVWSGGAGWWNWERPFVSWAERQGFEIDVAISQDLERHPEVLAGRRLFVSVGHDEYWSWGMRDTVEGFIAGGGNAAFLTGNTCCWQVRLDKRGRTMTCFKYRAHEDPVAGTGDERYLAAAWADRRIGRPESMLTGLSFAHGGYSRYGLGVPRASGAYTVWRPDHWAFEGTGLTYGDALGLADAIVAYEVDGCELTMEDGIPIPIRKEGVPASLEVLATAPARLWSQDEQPSRYRHEPGERESAARALFGDGWEENLGRVANNHACLVSFREPGCGTVFNVGVTDWAYGLADPAVARITRNVLTRLSS